MSSHPQVKKILLLSANPRGTSQLRLDEERREIQEGLRRARQREQFLVESAEAVRYRDIRRAILDCEPNIVHFSGHGAGEEGLAFEDESGQVKLVSADALASLFKLFAEQVECVVLNACYSQVQAKAIAEQIPCVVGMSKAIGDRAAIEFAIGFYDALGAGKSLEFAYKLGCNAIQIAGTSENLTPQLLIKELPSSPTELESQRKENSPKIASGSEEVIELWLEKLIAFHKEDAITADPEKKFQLKKLIQECQQKIEELGG